MEYDFDIVVAGGGAAGTFAAWGARGAGRIAVLDFGNDYTGDTVAAGSLSALRGHESLKTVVLGKELEALDRIFLRRAITPKLAGPLMRFASKDTGAWDQGPDEFRAIQSLAKGGLANVWGAQVYRFREDDLRDFPVRADEFASYYDRVAAEIGISGSEGDDLADFHGREPMLQPPVESSRLSERLLQRYSARRDVFRARGIRIGKPRLAVLTRPHDGRPALQYDNLEFVVPRNGAYYSPHLTLEKLVRDEAIAYLPRRKVTSFSEDSSGVVIHVEHVDTRESVALRARKLILCLGCINTARLVLHSRRDFRTRLPILETPMTFTPLLDPAGIGEAHAERSYSSDLAIVVEDRRYPAPLVGMIYNLDGLLRAGLLFDFPLPATAVLEAIRSISPALLALQLYYPQAASPDNRLWLDAAGAVHFSYRYTHDFSVERRVLAALRRIRFFSAARLSKLAPPGDSIHYGGTIPMRAAPQHAYEADRFGRLHDTRHVFIGDSAGFPFLPAKNLTYTIMANACRIGEHVAGDLRDDRDRR